RGAQRRAHLPPHRWRRLSHLRRRAARLEPAPRRLPRPDGVLAVRVRLTRRAVLCAGQSLCGAVGGGVGGAGVGAAAGPPPPLRCAWSEVTPAGYFAACRGGPQGRVPAAPL